MGAPGAPGEGAEEPVVARRGSEAEDEARGKAGHSRAFRAVAKPDREMGAPADGRSVAGVKQRPMAAIRAAARRGSGVLRTTAIVNHHF